MKRARMSWVAAGVLLAVPALSAAGAAHATTPALVPAADTICTGDFGTDFDGNGKTEVAIGVPGQARGSVNDVGVVEVRHPCSAHATDRLQLPGTRRSGEEFGSSLAVGTFNNDDYTDLAVGVPGLRVGGHARAGGVALFYGSSTGLHYAKTLTQASPNVAGSVQSHAWFGTLLYSHSYAPDRTVSLRIGVPFRDVDGKKDAGAVVDYALREGHVVTSQSQQITLASPHMPGTPGENDFLGDALYGDRVGVPGHTVDGQPAAGAVLVTEGRNSILMTQGSPGVPGAPEAGDKFGAALSGQWIGAPGESVGDILSAGIVERPATDPADRESLTIHDLDPTQTPATADRFGYQITETGVVVDDTEFSPRQLLVASADHDTGGVSSSGIVSVIGESDDPDGEFSLGTAYGSLQPATVRSGGFFGLTVGRDGQRTVLVGYPGSGTGEVSVFTAPSGFDALPTRTATWTEDSGTPEDGDGYGNGLGNSPPP